MPTIDFVFLREGPSDEGLLPHLRTLLAAAGFTEVNGTSRPYKGTSTDKVRQVLEEAAPPGLILIHRDADSKDAQSRHDEIANAHAAAECQIPCIGVVPVQEMEAWLLVDEDEIRSVAGKPSGKSALNLPKLSGIENVSGAKEILKEAILIASGSTGRRHKARAKAFDADRQILLQRLDVINGPIRQLPSWQRLEADISTFARNYGVGT